MKSPQETLSEHVAADPRGIGYAAMSPSELLAAVNAVRLDVLIPLGVISGADLRLALAPAQFALRTKPPDVREFWKGLLDQILPDAKVHPGSPQCQTIFASAVQEGLLDPATVATVGTRPGSIVESLWGPGAVATADDIARL
jgi:hypothetical protein